MGRSFFQLLRSPSKKKSQFECPSDHFEALRARLPRVRKVLVIGWRAMEDHFLKLLSEHLQFPLEVMVVITRQTALPKSDADCRWLSARLCRDQFNGSPAGSPNSWLVVESYHFLNPNPDNTPLYHPWVKRSGWRDFWCDNSHPEKLGVRLGGVDWLATGQHLWRISLRDSSPEILDSYSCQYLVTGAKQ